MGLKLEKGSNGKLEKADGSTLTEIVVALGWDANANDGAAFDLDSSVLCLTSANKLYGLPTESWFVWYNNLESPNGVIKHHGDNLTGTGDGDDEQITVHLDQLTPEVDRVLVAVTIYKAAERGQKFGDVRNSYARIFVPGTNEELARYDLREDYAGETAVEFAEIYRNGGGWKVRALGAGKADAGALFRNYGVADV
jgi:tellurium resistance protein TerD